MKYALSIKTEDTFELLKDSNGEVIVFLEPLPSLVEMASQLSIEMSLIEFLEYGG